LTCGYAGESAALASDAFNADFDDSGSPLNFPVLERTESLGPQSRKKFGETTCSTVIGFMLQRARISEAQN
jgi:hypothetical protein